MSKYGTVQDRMRCKEIVQQLRAEQQADIGNPTANYIENNLAAKERRLTRLIDNGQGDTHEAHQLDCQCERLRQELEELQA